MSTKTRKLSKPAGLEPAPAASSPFMPRSAVKRVEGVLVKSMSPMLSPKDWPQIDGANAVLIGVFTKLFKTKSFERKVGNKLVKNQGWGAEIVPVGAPVGVGLPVTATLKTSLDITYSGEDDSEASSPFIGRVVEVELLDKKIPSKKGNDAWHFLGAIYPPDFPGTTQKQLA